MNNVGLDLCIFVQGIPLAIIDPNQSSFLCVHSSSLVDSRHLVFNYAESSHLLAQRSLNTLDPHDCPPYVTTEMVKYYVCR